MPIDDEDDEQPPLAKGGWESAYRQRRQRQEDKLAESYGVSPEEVALAREVLPREAFELTDPVLGTKAAFDLFSSARTPAEKVRAGKKLAKNLDEVADVAEKLSKLFR